MDSGPVAGTQAGERPFSNPWPALLGGLAANTAACLWFKAFGSQALLLVLPGLLATGAAVVIRPRSPLVLGLAALSGFFGCWGLGAWDSAQLLVGVLSAVAAFAAIVVLLPRSLQRAIVSLMIVLHFIGILSAVASVPPTAPLMNWAWTYFYRPYLQFMYLNNAYHFYSPEPGPGILVWFYVRYEDGSADWYKIPDRSQNALTQEYQRRLSLAESTNQLQPVGPVLPEIIRRRLAAAEEPDGIPIYPGWDAPMQRREPTPYSKDKVKTYARFIAHLKARETGKTVRSVKIYRVVHNIPSAKEIAAGVDPAEKHFYYPFYQGEFSPDGELKDPQDPYLYWIIPIVKTHDPAAFRQGRLRPPRGDEEHFEIVDLLEEHANMPARSSVDPPPNFVPGGQAEEPAKKSAALNPATPSLPR
jgi:hypothetical protein